MRSERSLATAESLSWSRVKQRRLSPPIQRSKLCYRELFTKDKSMKQLKTYRAPVVMLYLRSSYTVESPKKSLRTCLDSWVAPNTLSRIWICRIRSKAKVTSSAASSLWTWLAQRRSMVKLTKREWQRPSTLTSRSLLLETSYQL